MPATRPAQRLRFFEALDKGHTIRRAASLAKFSEATAYRLLNEEKKTGLRPGAPKEESAPKSEPGTNSGSAYLQRKRESGAVGPIPYEHLSPEAKRALEDFDYFRRRYFGHVPTPWQREAAETLVNLLDSELKEYVVLNCPPGSGKSQLLQDIACWMIARNRGVRILFGSATMQQAVKNLNSVRRALERAVPEPADEKFKERGLAVDAESTMARDFGRFKPVDREQWTREAFIVMQHEEHGAITEKESTLQAYGMDANYLGDRVDACIWDDLVDDRTARNVEMRELLEDRWRKIAESRLEPSGMMALVGQRLSSDDLYRYCLDMVQPFDLEDEDLLDEMSDEEIEGLRRDKKYRHIVFKAHYEDRCTAGSHKLSATPYPEGCLLDPRRVSWRDVRGLMSNSMRDFQVLYQQEDLALEDVFVSNDWIYGYGGSPGCIDHERDRWELPPGLDLSECVPVVTADPSPTNYWAVEFWLYNPKFNQRILIDLHRSKMEVGDFLDYLVDEQRYIGIMEEWLQASRRMGIPMRYWVFERNAAQRFYLQFDLVKKWGSMNSVEILAHDTTGRSKPDEDLGISSIREHYRFGRVRLPGKGEGKVRSMRLIDEVTKYGHARTDDCVMAHWFFEWNLDRLKNPTHARVAAWRPGFVKRERLMSRA